jgi:hypothetical protein
MMADWAIHCAHPGELFAAHLAAALPACLPLIRHCSPLLGTQGGEKRQRGEQRKGNYSEGYSASYPACQAIRQTSLFQRTVPLQFAAVFKRHAAIKAHLKLTNNCM